MGGAGFSLMEVLIALVIFTLTVSGLIYGYVQANRMAELSSMSLAAQGFAIQGMEQARSAQWNSKMWPVTNGPGTSDELLCPTNYAQIDTLDVPTTGDPIYITNYIAVTTVSDNPPLRQIRSDVVWACMPGGRLYTNSVITMRAPDQ